jgi:hypothetical protein
VYNGNQAAYGYGVGVGVCDRGRAGAIISSVIRDTVGVETY